MDKKEKIQNNVDNIRSECDDIEEEITPKKVSTRGDPIVRLH